MITTIIKFLVQNLLQLLPDDIVKKGIASLLDTIEKTVKESKTTIDDIAVLPLIEMIRNSLAIDKNLPGDIENRINYSKELVKSRYFEISDKVDFNIINDILISPGIWQVELEKYLDNLKQNAK